MKVLSSAAEFHDFTLKPTIVGVFEAPIIAEEDAQIKNKDGEPKWRKGDLLGYLFEDENGAHYNVGAQTMIKKAIEKTGIGAVLGITFKGKTETSTGNPLSRYEVIEFDGEGHDGDPWKEALAFYGNKNSADKIFGTEKGEEKKEGKKAK